MIDDPLALMSLGIWLMAAGMYPVGFLFGACSACCDECPAECSKCTQAYDLPSDNGPCHERFDSVVITSEYDSRTFNVNRFGDILQASGAYQVQLTDTIECPDQIVGTVNLYLSLVLDSVSPNDNAVDECGCEQCNLAISYTLRMAERGVLGRVPFDDTLDYPGVRGPGASFNYDKCSQTSATIELTVTKAEIISSFLGIGDFEFDCPGATAFFSDIENFTVTVEYNLDAPCDCGACCREGECSENVLESYCERNSEWWGEFPDGVWQGVGTSCRDDPPPCEE